MKKLLVVLMITAISGMAMAVNTYDQTLTPGVIFGDGNADGSFTVEQANGIELGLRGKLRHNASGLPENTFNSNGDGTYSFDSGIAPTQSATTAVWSFEWSINSDFDGSGGYLNAYTYELGLDSDPGAGTSFSVFDPINATYFDHSIGTNVTTDSTDSVASDASEYASLIAANNVAQNSWKPSWFLSSFDPTVDGVYDFYLAASNGNGEIARTSMKIIVGEGAPVPVPGAFLLGSLGVGVVGWMKRRRSF